MDSLLTWANQDPRTCTKIQTCSSNAILSDANQDIIRDLLADVQEDLTTISRIMDSLSPQADQDQRMRAEIQACSSNAILSDADQDIIRGLVSEAQQDLITTEAEIFKTQTALEKLVQRRTKGIERIQKLRGGIAAHKKLPPELMAAIFVECHQSGVVGFPHSGSSSAPWLLGQVCSGWRRVVLAEPLLWGHIRAKAYFSSSRLAMEMIHDIFSRRGGKGIIQFSVSPGGDEDWMTVFNLVSKYSSRVRGLNLNITGSTSPHLDSPFEFFGALESLSLSYKRHFDGSLLAAFSNAQNLRSLAVSHAGSSIVFPITWSLSLILPWAQLTDLCMKDTSTRTILDILSRCTQLLRLTVNFSREEIMHRGAFHSVVLRQLRSLVITPNHTPDLEKFLDALVLPSLKRLSFASGFWGPWPQESILKLLTHSTRTMDSFESSESIPPDCVLLLMRAMPNLTQLSTHTDYPISDLDFQTMISEKLVPELRVFRDWRVSSYQTALDFLESRWSKDIHGRYQGICDAKFWIREDLAANDEFQRVLGMRRDGRMIEYIYY